MEDVNENRNEDVNRIDIIWEDWKNYKKAEFRFSYKSERSENAAKRELIELSSGNEDTAIKIVEQSIANGWKGLFKLKENGNGYNRKNIGASDEAVARIIAEKFGSDSGKR